MAFDKHANFGYSTVATAPSPATSGTTLVLAANFSPAPTPPYNIVVCPAGVNPTATNAEICRVTANSSGTLTITRAQESSSARTILVGDQVSVAITAKTFTDIENTIDRATGPTFYVEDYGAAGDGTTNDTAAIQAAIDAAYAAGGGIVQFRAKNYACNSAPRTDRGGNAILALPTAGGTGQKISLRGPGGRIPTYLSTTRTDTYDNTNGQPSLLGGPTSLPFANLLLSIENITFFLPANPNISALDLIYVGNGSLLENVGVSTTDPFTSAPTHITQFGIRTPTISNFGPVVFGLVEIFGCYSALVANSEHMVLNYLITHYNVNGIAHKSQSHANVINYWTSEKCNYHLTGVPFSSNPVAATGVLVIDQWDVEDSTGAWHATVNHLYDAGGLKGSANFLGMTPSVTPLTPNVTSGSLFALRDLNTAQGYHAVTVPASGSSYTLYRDTTYYVSGGTVSAIAVDGQTTGLTSGAVTVPSGRPLAITYSSVPTVKAICM